MKTKLPTTLLIAGLSLLCSVCSTYAETIESSARNEVSPNGFERSYDLCAEGAANMRYRARRHLDAPFYCFTYAGNVYMEVRGSLESFIGKDYDELCSALSDSGCDLAGISGYGDKSQEYSTIRSTAAFFYSADGKSYVLCGDLTAYIPKGARTVERIDMQHERLVELSETDVKQLDELREWHAQNRLEYRISGHVMFLRSSYNDATGKWTWRLGGEPEL